jgi:hypothetical protein
VKYCARYCVASTFFALVTTHIKIIPISSGENMLQRLIVVVAACLAVVSTAYAKTPTANSTAKPSAVVAMTAAAKPAQPASVTNAKPPIAAPELDYRLERDSCCVGNY